MIQRLLKFMGKCVNKLFSKYFSRMNMCRVIRNPHQYKIWATTVYEFNQNTQTISQFWFLVHDHSALACPLEAYFARDSNFTSFIFSLIPSFMMFVLQTKMCIVCLFLAKINSILSIFHTCAWLCVYICVMSFGIWILFLHFSS